MNLQIILKYALIKSIYEEKKDYIDVFVPYLLKILSKAQKPLECEFVQKELEAEFNFKIPESVIDILITRATRRGYTKRKRRVVDLEKKGRDYVQIISSREIEIEKEINNFLEDIKEFLEKSYNFPLPKDEVLNALQSFIRKNLYIVEFFSPQNTVFQEGRLTKIEYYLVDYFKEAKEYKPKYYHILENIFYGILISSLLLYPGIDKVSKKFKTLDIYLDTNFLFSIMDLHLSSITKPAQELFELLKDYKFRLKVFDFSINEMVRVVKGYLSERHKYFPHIKVDSIYSNLKNKGWTREDCIGFISNIEQKIYALGIQIENTGIDLNKWEIPKDDIYLRISQYKPDQHPLGQKHDICAIEKIKEIRKRPQRNIEDCIALFLTSDRKLAKFNLVESGHRENFTVCEVILDKLFTVLLWFKNPQAVKELPLTIVLSTQFEILISKDIWNRFFNTVMSLRKENEISEDGISMLVYHNNITEDLILIKDPREINEEFILNKIKERKKEMDENRERMIEEGKKEIEEKYTTEMQKKDEEYLAKIERIKANLKEEVKKKARIVSNLLFAIIPILFLILCCWLSKRGLLTSQSSIFALVGFFVNIFGIKIDIFKCRKKIQDSFLNRNYEKMLEKLDIKEF